MLAPFTVGCLAVLACDAWLVDQVMRLMQTSDADVRLALQVGVALMGLVLFAIGVIGVIAATRNLMRTRARLDETRQRVLDLVSKQGES